jgi:hypothetical protein
MATVLELSLWTNGARTDGQEAPALGYIVASEDRIQAALSERLARLGLPQSLAENHSGVLLRSLARHAERWLNAELLEFPVALALARDNRDAWISPNVLLTGFATPDTLMEALSLPTVRGRIRYIRQHGSRKDRKRLKSLLGRVATGSPGRPRQTVETRSDVQLALEVQQAQIQLREAGNLRQNPDVRLRRNEDLVFRAIQTRSHQS